MSKEDLDTELEFDEDYADFDKFENMSDEDFFKYIEAENASKEEEDTQAEESEEDSATDDSLEENDNEDADEEETEEESNSDSGDDDSTEEPSDSSDEDLDATFKKLFSTPIKANGSEFMVESVKEAISLMQKGAGFEAKMKKLKPASRIHKSLEKHNISEDEVNFLIDVFNGDKKAIKQLMAKHNLDALEVEDEEGEYTPKSNLISNKFMELDEYIDVVKDSPFEDKINVVINKTWDEESRDIIANDPQLLGSLLEEFELGRFDMIQSIVAKENATGVNKLPDIKRYAQLAMMLEKGALKVNQTPKTKPETKQKAKPSPRQVSKPNVTKTKKEYTPKELDAMSDAEFLKIFGKL